MDDVVIRAATEAEIPAVAELRWRWILEQGGSPVASHDDYVAYFVDWARRCAATHRCTVVVRDDEVLGMAWLAILARVPSPRRLKRASGDVQCVYLVPEERNGGVGTRLMRAVLALADELELERTTVHSSPLAVPMYARVGFGTSDESRQRVRPALDE